jgi:hypothetical protein
VNLKIGNTREVKFSIHRFALLRDGVELAEEDDATIQIADEDLIQI